jgi:uncharacterized protein
MRFYVVEKLSRRRSKTPEGYLLLEGVPIARTGLMIYGPDETPISVGRDGVARVKRDEDEVFRPETIASFAGKPVTNDHPEEDVNPDNWADYTIGVCLNPRRGTGMESDLLLADLLVTKPDGIAAIESGKVEISCGYEADYEDEGPGIGRQTNIIGNHVALVDEGRCGPRCAIGDRKTAAIRSEDAMSKKSILDRVRAAFKARDEAGMEAALDSFGEIAGGASEKPVGDTHVHLHMGGAGGAVEGAPAPKPAVEPGLKEPGEVVDGEPGAAIENAGEGRRMMSDEDIEKRFASLEAGHKAILDAIEALKSGGKPAADSEVPPPDKEDGKLGEEKPEGTGDSADPDDGPEIRAEAPEGTNDAAFKTADSTALEPTFREVLAMAEILAPGIKLPTFDAKARKRATVDAICALRRAALATYAATEDGAAVLESIQGAGRRTVDAKLACPQVRMIFNAAAGVQRTRNADVARGGRSLDMLAPAAQRLTVAQINEINRKHYGLDA